MALLRQLTPQVKDPARKQAQIGLIHRASLLLLHLTLKSSSVALPRTDTRSIEQLQQEPTGAKQKTKR
jgi:hypothetical protein